MRIKKLKLRNIRSYLQQEIDFPSGSVLLSGDIGSGKSSILYAIDFALFGITNELSGGSLLRNGAREGDVELHFEVDGKDVVIKRSLKRAGGVAQSAGYLICDGVRRELTPLELKQRILELLHYPPQELSSRKSLVYRYTVYTPQDEMKSILLGDEKARVDTLRKVFGIDKYKRIRDNTELLLSAVKGTLKTLAVMVRGAEEKRNTLRHQRDVALALQGKTAKLSALLDGVRQRIAEKKRTLELAEKDRELSHEQRKELDMVETMLTHYGQLEEKYTTGISTLEIEVRELNDDVQGKHIPVSQEQVAAVQEKIRKVEEKSVAIRERVATSRAFLAGSRKNLLDLQRMDVCPLCMQPVPPSHLKQVKQQEEESMKKHEAVLLQYEQEEKALQVPLQQMKHEHDILRTSLHQHDLLAFKRDTLQEKMRRLEEARKEAERVALALKEGQHKRLRLRERMAAFVEQEEKYAVLHGELQKLHEEEKHAMVQAASSAQELKTAERERKKLEDELLVLEERERHQHDLLLLREWMETCFVRMLALMERKVMLKVHSDFDALFQKWFMMLVDSDVMKVRLDEAFSPVIEQNGHETEYAFLSGGEKTAAALAYRLSLNQVITALIGMIKTKDLLILDEPTDGFSQEQLDRVRTVFDDLDAEQIILVSHEDKIESFVDTVIRVEKHEHVSRVL